MVCAVGNLKDDAFLDLLRADCVEAYPGTVRLIERLRADGVGTAVVSASRNCAAVLDAAEVGEFLERLAGLGGHR